MTDFKNYFTKNVPPKTITMEIDEGIENVENAVEPEVKAEVPDKTDKEEYAYLKNSGFSSEAFKIELKNLPRRAYLF